MRKWMAIMLMLLMAVPAWAEGLDSPALTNPADRYETYFEQTDGSEMSLFMLMDMQNDEKAIVEEYGALQIDMNFVDETGAITDVISNIIQMSEYGPMQIMRYGSGIFAMKLYCIGDKTYSHSFTMASREDAVYTAEEFAYTWESLKFPYGTLDILHGVRQDEAGNTYVLIRSDDMFTFEFAAGENMEIKEIRVYMKEADGTLVLWNTATFKTLEAEPIPASVQKLMDEDFGGAGAAEE